MEWDRAWLRNKRRRELGTLTDNWTLLESYFEDVCQKPRLLGGERDAERYKGSRLLLLEGMELLLGWWRWWGRVGRVVIEGLTGTVPVEAENVT